MEKRCFGCMKLNTQSAVCPHCGFGDTQKNQPHQLPMGYLLQGRYLIGRVLGQGGFGITYLGYDQTLAIPVAVKEFFPNGTVTRDQSRHVTDTSGGGSFEKGLERFLREAAILARLRNVPEIVKVYDVFQENGTAYIVMEYVEGLDLRTYLKRLGRLLTPEETLQLLRPVMQGLEKVHKEGLIHRDISPDNIMLQPSGKIKLLDFGTARDTGSGITHSTQSILKYGFAPMEQYQSRGNLGPWTDVYALCATAYYCMTGSVPPEAPERLIEHAPMKWDQIPGLSPAWATVLDQGMDLSVKDRIQSADALERMLFHIPVPPAPKPDPNPDPEPNPQPIDPPTPAPKPKHTKKKITPVLAALALLLVIGAAIFVSRSIPGETLPEETVEETTAEASAPTALYPLRSLDAGNNHTVALRSDGTVRAKGTTMHGQCLVSGWTDMVSVAAGADHTVGLRASGTVAAVGNNQHGQCQVSTWRDIASIAAGEAFTLGLKWDGTVVSTKENHRLDWTGITAIAAGRDHAVGLKADGTVVANGPNLHGECEVYDWTDIVAVTAGHCHTVGLKADGTVAATGLNAEKYIGSDWSGLVAIAAGGYHTVGLKADGTVVATGDFRYGQCRVYEWQDIVAIAAGTYHTLGLKADGTLVSTGFNDCGECDVSDWDGIAPPLDRDPEEMKIREPGTLSTNMFLMPSIAAGDEHTVAVKRDGTVLAAGENGSGQCDISHWQDVLGVAAGCGHTVGLKTDGTVVAAGDDQYGQCQVSGWKNMIYVAAAENHTIGLRQDGTVLAVGDNTYGQCDVSQWRNIVAIAAGSYHTVGLKADGTAVAVGSSSGYDVCQLSDWKNLVGIAAGSGLTLGITADGGIFVKGNPDTVEDLEFSLRRRGVTAIFADGLNAAGLRPDGTLVGTMPNYDKQKDTNLYSWQNIVTIAVGKDHAVGLKTDGTVVAAEHRNLLLRPGSQCNISHWKDIRIP